MTQMSRRVLFTSGTMGMAAALGLSKFVDAAENDLVLDHAGREMLRLHQRVMQPPAVSLAVAAANLRLLATHPYTKAHRGVADRERGIHRLHRELTYRYGYVGTADDLRNLTIGVTPDLEHFVTHKLNAGRVPDVLLWGASNLEKIHLSSIVNPARRFFAETPQLRTVQYDTTDQSGPDIQHYAPCDTLFMIESSFSVLAVGLSLTAAGAILGAMAAGLAIFFSIVRYGGCS